MNKSKHLKILWLTVIFVLALSTPNAKAYAYLDLGSSSFLIQIIATGALAILLALRLYSIRVIAFIRRLLGIKSEIKKDDDITDV